MKDLSISIAKIIVFSVVAAYMALPVYVSVIYLLYYTLGMDAVRELASTVFLAALLLSGLVLYLTKTGKDLFEG